MKTQLLIAAACLTSACTALPPISGISGVWTTGIGYSGVSIVLQQSGQQIDGSVTYWSDAERDTNTFSVTGIADQGKIILTFVNADRTSSTISYILRDDVLVSLTPDDCEEGLWHRDRLFRPDLLDQQLEK